MHNSLGRKAQFFILTTVVIVGVFFTLSKYITPYSFIDTSRGVEEGEVFFFNNVKEKAIKTVEISDPSQLASNLGEYEDFVENMAEKKGFDLSFTYMILTNEVNTTMILTSPKYTLKSNFLIPLP